MQTTVLGTRLTDAERAQVVAAAQRLGLSVSQFMRQALLASSAQIERKAAVIPNGTIEAPEREPLGVVMVDTEPAGHWVDGERVDAY